MPLGNGIQTPLLQVPTQFSPAFCVIPCKVVCFGSRIGPQNSGPLTLLSWKHVPQESSIAPAPEARNLTASETTWVDKTEQEHSATRFGSFIGTFNELKDGLRRPTT